MALLPEPPFVRVLMAMQATGQAIDFNDLAGVPGVVTIRHMRKRKPVRSERPCITLMFVSDEASPGETGHTQDEIVRAMTVDVQADIEVAPEDAGTDPTGLLMLGRMLAAFFQACRADGSPLMRLCDWTIETDIEPEDRSQAEDGRLVRSVIVLYRVLQMDGNVLLAAGENA